MIECFADAGFVDADCLAEHLNTGAGVRVGIRLEGGIVQSVFADAPIDALVIDYDVDTMDEDSIYDVPQGDGTASRAWLYEERAPAMPDELDRLYALVDARSEMAEEGADG